MELEIIGHIHTDFSEKFGVPRQSGLESLHATITFEPQYAVEEAFRGIEGYSHLWLLWQFSKAVNVPFSPTVRPPKLGGNTRMGVFATRSPFRPNHIGLSSVKLDFVEKTEHGIILHISGADLMDGTPILDIKPYLVYTDCHTDAISGFSVDFDQKLNVIFECDCPLSNDKKEGLLAVLEQDPRPSYIEDETRVYGMTFASYNIKFKVSGRTLIVLSIEQ